MASNKLLITNGRIIDPATRCDEIGDLLVSAGRIEAVGQTPDTPDARVIDAEGMLVVPGFVDLHVHFREPGFEYKEDIETGSRAAARGGFTTVACMPNTNPVIDNPTVVRYVGERAREVGLARVMVIGSVSKGEEGKELAELGLMAEAGAIGFSDDGHPVRTSRLMRLALEYASMFSLPVIDHCEDPDLAAEGVMNEGRVSTVLGLRGQPAEAEEVMVARDIALAKLTGGHLHVAHVSTRGSVELVRRAKAQGLLVTAEVTPHHLVLTDNEVKRQNYSGNTKVNPPLRTQDDIEALIEGLADGTIDFIATDHAPHDMDEKDVEFERAAFGVVGLETAFAVLNTDLVEKGKLDLATLIGAMTLRPAQTFGLPYGTLEPGSPADITIIDPSAGYTVNPDRFASRGRNTPFAGRQVRGAVHTTILGGRVTFSAGNGSDVR